MIIVCLYCTQVHNIDYKYTMFIYLWAVIVLKKVFLYFKFSAKRTN